MVFIISIFTLYILILTTLTKLVNCLTAFFLVSLPLKIDWKETLLPPISVVFPHFSTYLARSNNSIVPASISSNILFFFFCFYFVQKGLSKNSSCLKEYEGVDTIEYQLPLRSCTTMTSTTEGSGTDLTRHNDNSEEEFFNTIILEPHPKLVTGHGKGFHIRCKYKKNGDKNQPVVNMSILRDSQELSGEHVKIGDPLILNITIESKHR